MSLSGVANSGILTLAAAIWVIAELCWALYPSAWRTPDEADQPAPDGAPAGDPAPGMSRRRVWGLAGVVARLVSSRAGDFAALSWEWVLKADGQVLYRLAAVDGHRERNPWMTAARLSPAESRLVRQDQAHAVALLADLARQRGHQVDGQPALSRRHQDGVAPAVAAP